MDSETLADWVRIINDCSCTHEEGDSDCVRHPTCPDCGEPLGSTRLAEARKLAGKLLDRIQELKRENSFLQYYDCCDGAIESMTRRFLELAKGTPMEAIADDVKSNIDQLLRNRVQAEGERDHLREINRNAAATIDSINLERLELRIERDGLRDEVKQLRHLREKAAMLELENSGAFRDLAEMGLELEKLRARVELLEPYRDKMIRLSLDNDHLRRRGIILEKLAVAAKEWREWTDVLPGDGTLVSVIDALIRLDDSSAPLDVIEARAREEGSDLP